MQRVGRRQEPPIRVCRGGGCGGDGRGGGRREAMLDEAAVGDRELLREVLDLLLRLERHLL